MYLNITFYIEKQSKTLLPKIGFCLWLLGFLKRIGLLAKKQKLS